MPIPIRGPTMRAQNRASIRAHNAGAPIARAMWAGACWGVPRYSLFLCPLASRRMVIKTAQGRGWGCNVGGHPSQWTPNREPNCGRPPRRSGRPMGSRNVVGIGRPIARRWGPKMLGGRPKGQRKLDGHLTARWRWTGPGFVAAPNREGWTARGGGDGRRSWGQVAA